MDLLTQILDQRSTVYLSLTSSLRSALIQPHKDASVLPLRAATTSWVRVPVTPYNSPVATEVRYG